MALAAASRTAFVAHSGLAVSPALKWMCEQNGTLFITRDRRHTVAEQVAQVRDALGGRRLTIFPEGTTGDGRGLLPFKSALLSAVGPLPAGVPVQPVALIYTDAADIAWLAGEPGLTNAFRILGRTHGVHLTLRFLPPLAGPRWPTARRSPPRHATRLRGAGALNRPPLGLEPRPHAHARVTPDLQGQELRLPDERLRRRAHGRAADARKASPGADGAKRDLVVLNTCHIREKAAEKVYSDIGRLRKARRPRSRMIAVAGCVAQAEGEEIMARAPAVDVVVGPQAYHRLPELIARARRAANARPTPRCRRTPSSPPCPRRRRAGAERVPDGAGGVRQVLHLLRRALHARRRNLAPVRDFRAEAERLVEAGAGEITLLGQNVNAWRGEDKGRAVGLDADKTPGQASRTCDRIRYTTSHPSDMDRGPDRRARRGRQADAVPALAGAVAAATGCSRR